MKEEDVLQNILELGTQKFSKPKKTDKKLYGKLKGAEDFLAFCGYIDRDFQTPYHIKLIADKLTQVEKGKIKRLIINMPPRHGKSQTTTRLFPVWYMGRNPKSEVMVASYSKDKAEEFTRFQRDLILSPEFAGIFPKLTLAEDMRSRSHWETSQGGIVIGAGVDGPFTGRGADLALIDDPIKNYEEAISETIQERNWNWYRSTLLTRLSPGGAIILIQTRWAKDDLSGRLIDSEGEVEKGGKWHVLRLPAILPDGKALWPEHFTLADLMEIRESAGEKIFQSLYQQEPVDIQERLFSDPKIIQSPGNLKLFAYLDPAFGGSDYSALTIGGITPEGIHIAVGNIWKGQIDETYNFTEKLCKQHKVTVLYVESNQAQKLIANELRKRNLIVKEVNNITNKHLRIVNFVKANWSTITFGHNVSSDYMKQVLNYSELASHDDAPDSLAGLIAQIKPDQGNLKDRYNFVSRLMRRI